MKKGISYYRKIFSEIEKGDIRPVYLLTGRETFIMEEVAGRLSKRIVGEEMKSFNLDVEYGSEVIMERFISTANSFPFLGERRLLVLKEMEKMKGKIKHLVEYCANPPATTVLILFYNTHDEQGRRIRPPKDFNLLEKKVASSGSVIQFDKLSHTDLQKWICGKAMKMGVKLDAKEAGLLIGSIGDDLFNIQNELDKLALVFDGKDVDEEDLASIIGRYRVNAIYDLIESIRPGNEKRTIELLSGIIESGAERPSTVLYLLTRHFLGLLKVKAGMRVSGFMQEKIARRADQFRTRSIIVWLENLRIAEILLKSTSFPEKMLVENAFMHSMNEKIMEDARNRYWVA